MNTQQPSYLSLSRQNVFEILRKVHAYVSVFSSWNNKPVCRWTSVSLALASSFYSSHSSYIWVSDCNDAQRPPHIEPLIDRSWRHWENICVIEWVVGQLEVIKDDRVSELLFLSCRDKDRTKELLMDPVNAAGSQRPELKNALCVCRPHECVTQWVPGHEGKGGHKGQVANTKSLSSTLGALSIPSVLPSSHTPPSL